MHKGFSNFLVHVHFLGLSYHSLLCPLLKAKHQRMWPSSNTGRQSHCEGYVNNSVQLIYMNVCVYKDTVVLGVQLKGGGANL